jgi:hypothetical protein
MAARCADRLHTGIEILPLLKQSASRMNKISKVYLDSLARIARPKRRVPEEELTEMAEQIEALMAAVARPVDDADECTVAFRETLEARPTLRQRAEEFERIARAPNPLAREICSTRALVELNAKARTAWADQLKNEPLNRKHPLINVNWDELPEWQKLSVREMAYELAAKYRRRVRQGAPEKCDQNALIEGLAEIFLRFLKSNKPPLALPHSVGSRFIRFAAAAARPFF